MVERRGRYLVFCAEHLVRGFPHLSDAVKLCISQYYAFAMHYAHGKSVCFLLEMLSKVSGMDCDSEYSEEATDRVLAEFNINLTYHYGSYFDD